MTGVLVFLVAWTTTASGAPTVRSPVPPPPLGDSGVDPTQLRGRVVCLDDAGQRQACQADSRRFALEDAAGRLQVFRADDPLAVIFQDPRVRERELLIWARTRNEGTLDLAIIKVYSVKQGQLHDLHYFCEVCHITAYGPGPCPCCRREMDLEETPVP